MLQFTRLLLLQAVWNTCATQLEIKFIGEIKDDLYLNKNPWRHKSFTEHPSYKSLNILLTIQNQFITTLIQILSQTMVAKTYTKIESWIIFWWVKNNVCLALQNHNRLINFGFLYPNKRKPHEQTNTSITTKTYCQW